MSEFARRRHALAERYEGGVVVLSAAPVAIRNGDVEHDYRQDSDVFYLTGFAEPECVVVLPTAHPEHRMVLFVRPREAEKELWNGPRAGEQGAKEHYGADAAFPISELGAKLPDYLLGHRRVMHRFGRSHAFDDVVIRAIEAARHRARRGGEFPLQIDDPAPFLHELRMFKSPEEIDAMKRAAAITRDAHITAMRETRPGRFEFELDAVLQQAFRVRGSPRCAYTSIVASGPNATILHYTANSRRMEAGDLVLVDAGCELDYYASDVTRTWPVGPTFSDAQRAVYDVVLRAQLASIRAIRPGATLDDVHRASVEVLTDGLSDLGVISGPRCELLEKEKHRGYYMHRTSHWLGMDVHDVGLAHQGSKCRPLEPGMVLTVEPGLYFGASDPTVPERFRGIGVRIEDDLLVTADGHINLTEGIPKAIDELEDLRSRAS